MPFNLRSRWLNLLHTLWFVPSVISAAYIVLAAVLVRIDDAEHFRGSWVFGGNDQAARTVLSVIAGSLITVAGLTFSVTMVVLQLTSSQFSPRVVRNYLGDRVAQLTIGSFVGIFAYCLVALRSIGNIAAERAPVPRLTLTVASGLALVALAMLIAFIHHITQLVQASELTARLGRQTVRAIDRLYPAQFVGAGADDADEIVARWYEAGPPGFVRAREPGFVQAVDLERLADVLPAPRPRVHVVVAPGDFAFADAPLVEIWPPECSQELGEPLRRNFSIGGERDIEQDAHFGVRQLADIALRAISPSVNDPTTAATCIAYIRSVLTRLAAREFPSAVRREREDEEPLVLRRREFGEYLEALAEIGRYVSEDARVAQSLLDALAAIAAAATDADADDRATEVVVIADAIGEAAMRTMRSSRDRAIVRSGVRKVRHAARSGDPDVLSVHR
jgi:uncharacterized membrane protein